MEIRVYESTRRSSRMACIAKADLCSPDTAPVTVLGHTTLSSLTPQSMGSYSKPPLFVFFISKRIFPEVQTLFPPLFYRSPAVLPMAKGSMATKTCLEGIYDCDWKGNGRQTLIPLVLADVEVLFQICLKW